MAITDKEEGVWGLDQVYNKINQGGIWDYDGINELWSWGYNDWGQVGKNNRTTYSSPVQISGTTWDGSATGDISGTGNPMGLAIKTDGTLWSWGYAGKGRLGHNQGNTPRYSSPVQVGADTTWAASTGGYASVLATKTDGTLWVWGDTIAGGAGQNSTAVADYSSPVQVTGTTWSTNKHQIQGGNSQFAIKTDGTLWTWGQNEYGSLGQNTVGPSAANGVSSPTQVPGTTWSAIKGNRYNGLGLKTDGTLWGWGVYDKGQLGLNQTSPASAGFSSPVQIGSGTDWSKIHIMYQTAGAIKTDGTLWTWGDNENGKLGVNEGGDKSSPVQVGTNTTWSAISNMSGSGFISLKTDGTMWAWGQSNYGQLSQNDTISHSSPVQIGSDTDWSHIAGQYAGAMAFKDF